MAYQAAGAAIESPSSGAGSSSNNSRGGGGGFYLYSSSGVGGGGLGFGVGVGDTTYTKVFVGGLAWETHSDTLHHHFQQYGPILEAVVITDKNTSRSKGYGFVTFRDPESARRACANPSPIIDGRRANCNLASLGRPRPSLPFGRMQSPAPYIGNVPAGQRTFIGGLGFQQPVAYGYQQGLVYPPYGYTAYGPEAVYQQGVYNPYVGQQYLHVYGVPGTVNPSMYPYNQMGQTISTGQGYTTVPGHQIMQFGGPNVPAAAIPPNQVSFPTGVGATIPAEPRFILPAHSTTQFVQGNGSDQTTG